MSKFYLISVALLCLLGTSCSQTEIDDVDTSSLELESRSLLPISVTYKTISGVWKSQSCDNLIVEYDNSSQGIITMYSGANSTQEYGGNINIVPTNGFELEITLDGMTTETSDDLFIDTCENSLCYENSNQNFIGTALEFIVDDTAIGF